MKPEAGESLREEALIIGLLALSVLLLLSNMGFCGVLGRGLRALQMGAFGTLGFIFPIVLFLVVSFIFSNRENSYAVLRMIALCFVYIFLTAMFQLFAGADLRAVGLKDFIDLGVEHSLGGGIIGGALAMVLYNLLGSAGAFLMLLAAIMVALVYVTEKPLMRILAGFSLRTAEKAGNRAREDLRELTETTRAYRRERQRLREEKRQEAARALDFDAMDLRQDSPRDKGDFGRENAGQDNSSSLLGDTDRNSSEELAGNASELQVVNFAERGASSSSVADAFHAESGIASPTHTGSEFHAESGEKPDMSSIFQGRISGVDEVHGTEMVGGIPISRATSPVRRVSPEGLEHGTESLGNIENLAEDAEKNLAVEQLGIEYSYAGNSQDEAIHEEDIFAETKAEVFPESSSDTRPRLITIPQENPEAGTRTIVTASGRVIQSDVEQIQKRVQEKRAAAASESENEEMKQEILEKKKIRKPYVFPPLSLLKRGGVQDKDPREEIERNAITLQQTLKSFGVGVTVTNVSVGPAVTRYELQPEEGIKLSKIVALTNDIKMRLAAADIRMEAPIPGKNAVGIEVPNKKGQVVYLGDVLSSEEFRSDKGRLSFGVGKDITGRVVVTDIAKMPHLLVAGATGSGKSVSINTLIMSIIYKYKPEEVRMIMVDPKVVELQVYNGIPHLLIPVVTDPKKAASALNWAVAEMTDRYKKFAETGVRDLKGYNERVQAVINDPTVPEEKPEKLPQIIIIIDELADLMMVSAQEVEDAICRIAQLARACGMHLVIATQRPSVNVITGLIKANVPSRIAFAVSSGVDSRTIIDMNGAEKLLGKGDMLFFPQGIPKPVRVQGAFVSDEEVQKVVDFLKDNSEAEYSEDIKSSVESGSSGGSGGMGGEDSRDELFAEAGALIIETEKASIGMLQRKFRIGFNRAARIMDQLADYGVVGPEEGTKPRRILMNMEAFDLLLSEEG